MGLFGCELMINNLPCAMVTRCQTNGEYLLTFERSLVSLEQIEAVPWANPTITEVSSLGTALPTGYGFGLKDIAYEYAPDLWKVRLAVADQYLGDVTGYVAQVDELETQLEAAEAAEAAAQGEAAQAQAAAQEAQATATEAQEILDIIVEGEGETA